VQVGLRNYLRVVVTDAEERHPAMKLVDASPLVALSRVLPLPTVPTSGCGGHGGAISDGLT